MSVPKRKALMAAVSARETEPSHATCRLYWGLMKANVGMADLQDRKDGNGLFTRGVPIRDLVEKFNKMLSALSDVSFFRKKQHCRQPSNRPMLI